MRLSSRIIASLSFVLAWPSSVWGERGRYDGDRIPTSLPSVPGGSITFFRVNDTASTGDPSLESNYGTLLIYFSTPGAQHIDPRNVKRAVVAIHESNRRSDVVFSDVYASLLAAKKWRKDLDPETVAILAPTFGSEADANFAFPYTPESGSYTSALVWSDGSWAHGANNLYPASTTISSFDVLDQVLQYFASDNYPNLEQIVVAGHGMGATMVQRYAVAGKQLALDVPVSYWIANPDAFAWLNESRPVPAAVRECKDYDDWGFGLERYGGKEGKQAYNVQLFKDGPTAARDNYATRTVGYALGLNVTDDVDSLPCAASLQGSNREERFLNWLTFFPPNTSNTVDYIPEVGAHSRAVYTSEAGVHRLFLDNWRSDGTIAPDFGPRHVEGDNPHPPPLPSRAKKYSSLLLGALAGWHWPWLVPFMGYLSTSSGSQYWWIWDRWWTEITSACLSAYVLWWYIDIKSTRR